MLATPAGFAAGPLLVPYDRQDVAGWVGGPGGVGTLALLHSVVECLVGGPKVLAAMIAVTHRAMGQPAMRARAGVYREVRITVCRPPIHATRGDARVVAIGVMRRYGTQRQAISRSARQS